MPTDLSSEERWQRRLDAEFPHGAIMTWDGADWSYTTPWIEVTGMAGLDPLVFWLTAEGRGFGPLALISYHETYRKGSHRLVQVTFTNVERSMLWCSQLSPKMTKLMDAERARLGVGA